MAQSRKAENAQKHRYWKKHIESWETSGLTQAGYCHSHNLNKYRFQYWKRKLRPSNVPAFIELALSNSQPSQTNPSLRLMIGNYHVGIERDFDPVTLAQLIGVLARL
jgi:hypothetical protein